MTSKEMESAVAALGLSLTEIADDINRLTGAKMTVGALSTMKRGEDNGGREPSHVVAVYLGLKLEHARRHELDLAQGLIDALERAELRLVRTKPPPDFMLRVPVGPDEPPPER